MNREFNSFGEPCRRRVCTAELLHWTVVPGIAEGERDNRRASKHDHGWSGRDTTRSVNTGGLFSIGCCDALGRGHARVAILHSRRIHGSYPGARCGEQDGRGSMGVPGGDGRDPLISRKAGIPVQMPPLGRSRDSRCHVRRNSCLVRCASYFRNVTTLRASHRARRPRPGVLTADADRLAILRAGWRVFRGSCGACANGSPARPITKRSPSGRFWAGRFKSQPFSMRQRFWLAASMSTSTRYGLE